MTRREQLLAALAEGDASAAELMARLPADQKWTWSVLRVNLTEGRKAGQIWVSHEGTFKPHDLRLYTIDESRAVFVGKRRPAQKSISSGMSVVESALANRTRLENVWSWRSSV